jgi:hypothetical protein
VEGARGPADRSAADRPEQLTGGGDRGRGGPLGQSEERHQRSRGVGQGHQNPAVHDPARGAQVRRPVQPRDHPVRAGLLQDQAEVPGERHERDQGVQVSRHDAELSPGRHTRTGGRLSPVSQRSFGQVMSGDGNEDNTDYAGIISCLRMPSLARLCRCSLADKITVSACRARRECGRPSGSAARRCGLRTTVTTQSNRCPIAAPCEAAS